MAPNVQIMPNNSVVYQQSGMFKKSHNYIQSDTEKTDDVSLPSRLRASDIRLTEKIVQGQFSSVWKARCHNSMDDEYAIKVFSSHQKTAWSNEKDIYNSIALNNNVLKFFGSDIHEGSLPNIIWYILYINRITHIYTWCF